MINTPAFIKPFGPVIYSNTLNPEILEVLQECKKVSEYVDDNVGYLLAGAIDSQLKLIRTPEQEKIILDHIYDHMAAYLDGDPNIVKEKFKLTEKSMWLNIQKAGEFNPPHHHDGYISGVIYLEVPDEIIEEKKKNPVGFKGYGEISFYYGEDISCSTYYHLMPIVGQIILFPAKLRHSVHPFYSDVRRVSVAFNLFKEAEVKP